MDSGLSVSQELSRIAHSERESHIPKVAFGPFDLTEHAEILLPLFYKGWLEVFGEDKSYFVTIKIKGVEHRVPEIEALLYWYLEQGCQIRICFSDGELVGMVIYQQVFADCVSIRFFYCLPEVRKLYLGKQLIDNIPDAKTLVFQTQKDVPPEVMFKRIGTRPIKISENNKLITWAMEWEKK